MTSQQYCELTKYGWGIHVSTNDTAHRDVLSHQISTCVPLPGCFISISVWEMSHLIPTEATMKHKPLSSIKAGWDWFWQHAGNCSFPIWCHYIPVCFYYCICFLEYNIYIRNENNCCVLSCLFVNSLPLHVPVLLFTIHFFYLFQAMSAGIYGTGLGIYQVNCIYRYT